MSPLCALKGSLEALRRGLENSCISHAPPMCPQGVLGGPQKGARKFVHFTCAPYVPSRGPRRPSEGGSKIRAFHIALHEPLWRAPKNSRGARRPSEGGSKIRAFHIAPHEPLWRAPKNSIGARTPSEGGSKIRAFHMSPLCALKGS